MKILPVILSGGFGTRLWPLSRKKMPKQFLENLHGDCSLFTRAINLTKNRDIFLEPIIVSNIDHKFFILEQFAKLKINPLSIILEPCGKNSLAAILAACYRSIGLVNDDVKLLVLPSDHLIDPVSLFEESVLTALNLVENNIVTFGIKPTYSATGYGYIKSEIDSKVERFVEKPSLQKAQEFLKNGDYFWNAGIFMFNVKNFLSESKEFLPKQTENVKKAINNAKIEGLFCQIALDDYEILDDISVDYAVIEKSKNVAMTLMKANWSDLGDFKSVYDINSKDENANVKKGDVELLDCKNSMVFSANKLIAGIGLDDVVVIESDDAILIANKNKVQDVKNLVKDFVCKNRSEVELHNKVFRPWGFYETLSVGKNFRVKKIAVNPKCSLSLQSHNFRSEHWVVTKGRAKVQNGDKIFDLNEGESTFIPLKVKHRLTNEWDIVLEIIEVQMGDYVGEDDIIRYEDVYGRN